MIANKQIFPVKCYEIIQIIMNSFENLKPIIFINVYYIADFMINVVSNFRLNEKKMYFDEWKMHLHRKKKTLYYVKRHNGHLLLKNNTSTPVIESAAFAANISQPAKSKETTIYQWHQMLAHVSDETIQHLFTGAEKMKIFDDVQIFKINECESCVLSKAREIVFRKSDNVESVDTFFFRINYDLIQMAPSLNQKKWISHFVCYAIDFHIVYTHRHKSDASSFMRKTINLISTRFNQKIVFIRSNEKISLNDDFSDFFIEIGIIFEISTPDTQTQNGHAERKGAILTIKTRAFRIDVGLPHYFWNEIIKTAAYIANRTSMVKHRWKIFYELMTNKSFNLNHLHIYDCKTYFLNKKIFKTLKLQKRAHINHLIEYEIRNIFRIWILSQRKMIRTKNVLFNDDSIYDVEDIDLMQMINESMLKTTYDPINVQHYTHITEIDLGDEEKKNLNVFFSNTTDFQSIFEKVNYFFILSFSELSTPGSITPTLFSSFHAPSSFQSAFIAPSASAEPPAFLMIDLDLDEANILSERVDRRRAPRRQAYAASLIEAAKGEISSYYAAFATFSRASQFFQSSSPEAVNQNEALIFTNSTNPSHFRIHRDFLSPELKNFRQLQKHFHVADFRKAMQTEIESLAFKSIWREIPINQITAAATSNAIFTMWVFRYKFDENEFFIKYKARLCVKSDLQQTQQKIYAVILTVRIFRVLMRIVAVYNLETKQYDAVNAFANSSIDETVYCKSFEGWFRDLQIILLLLRTLYGLKQSPALWYKQLHHALIDMGFEPVLKMKCLFINQNFHVLLFFFVDDIVILYDRIYIFEVDHFQTQLFERFEMRYMRKLKWFLDIHITRFRIKHFLSLCQDFYIEKLIKKFNISSKIKTPTLLFTTQQLNKHLGQATPQKIHAYQQKVGSINFAAMIIRPDIAHAVFKLSEFLTNPSKFHMKCVDRTIAYLEFIKRFAIRFNLDFNSNLLNLTFINSSDASFADDLLIKYSSQGYAFKLFENMIDWKASKQRIVTTSSTEAELLTVTAADKKLIWWHRFFEAINFQINHILTIQCDNLQTIRALSSPKFTTKLRHVNIHRHWLRQKIGSGRINLTWTSITTILADELTKALPPQKHADFIKLMDLVDQLNQKTDQKNEKISDWNSPKGVCQPIKIISTNDQR